jgi:hypothetical protein
LLRTEGAIILYQKWLSSQKQRTLRVTVKILSTRKVLANFSKQVISVAYIKTR